MSRKRVLSVPTLAPRVAALVLSRGRHRVYGLDRHQPCSVGTALVVISPPACSAGSSRRQTSGMRSLPIQSREARHAGHGADLVAGLALRSFRQLSGSSCQSLGTASRGFSSSRGRRCRRPPCLGGVAEKPPKEKTPAGPGSGIGFPKNPIMRVIKKTAFSGRTRGRPNARPALIGPEAAGPPRFGVRACARISRNR